MSKNKNFSDRTVENICKKGITMSPSKKATEAYEYFEKHPECMEICIVGEHGEFMGLLTRSELMYAFGGRYGFTLHQRNLVIDMARTRTLIVYSDYTIENVSRLAMERISKELYDAVVVLKHNRYFGIVTIKDLLTASISIQIERAIDLNPLTSLPGNRTIEERIHSLIGSRDFFAIMYLDLDNFKAYNDAYGFPNGDRMIQAMADSMKQVYGEKAFLGHVGGDDFVIITRQRDVQKRAEEIINIFKSKLKSLYNETDWEKGFIAAKNRKGIVEEFPIVSISIAVVTNQDNYYDRMTCLNEQIVMAKKKAKHVDGNSVFTI